MSNAELLEFYSQKRIDGLDFSLMRKEMERKGIDATLISGILRCIDDDEQKELRKTTAKNSSKNLLIGGVITFIFGLFITVFTFLKFDGGFILMYGAILSGAGMLLTGIAKYKR